MKRFLPYIIILVVLVGIFSPTNKISAQLPTDIGTCTIAGTPPDIPDTKLPNVQRSECTGPGKSFLQNSPSGASPVADPGATEIGLKADANCSVFGNLGDCISSIFARIAWLIMTMMSWLLWLAGVLLNYVIKETVLTMKEGVDKMNGINIGWKVIRDIMNIGFIFLLVYEGILMIIGQSGKEKVKKFIFSIVLAALLINFSLFFTKVLIDASNIVTIGLYNSMIDSSAQSSVPGGNDSTGDVIERPVEGISAPFMQALNLQQLYGGNSFDNISRAVGGGTNMLIFFLMGSVLFLILAFVFFAISMMFIVRYITLLILLMTSPVAYMGSAIPGMSTYSKQWWDSLKGQLLFAPIYMLITMVVLKLIESDNFIKTEGAEWAGFVNNASSTATVSGAATNSVMSLLLNFSVIIGLAIASLVIAKTSATKGSGYIKEATGKLTAFAGGAVMGGTAWASRKSLGYVGNKVSSSAELQEDAIKKTGFGGAWARTKLYTARTARDATFDVRNASIPTSVVGDVVEGTLGRTSAGRKLGLNNVSIPSIAVGAPLSGLTGVGKGGEKGYRDEKTASDKAVRDREAANANELELAKAKQAVIDGAKDTATAKQIEDMEKALSKLSDKQTEALVAGNRDLLEKLNFANSISVKQLEAINKSDQFSDEEKSNLKNKRFEQIKTIYDTTALAAYTAATAVPVGARTAGQIADIKRMTDARERVKGLSDSELEMIDPNYFDPARPEGVEFIAQLKAGQVDNITSNKGGKFSATQRENVKTERMKPLRSALSAGNVAAIQSIIRKSDPKTMVGYMKVEGRGGIKIAMDPAVLPIYTPKTLQRMAAQDSMTDNDISELRAAILGAGLPPTHPTVVWLNDPNKGGIEFP